MSDFFDKLKKGAKETGEKASILAKIGGIKTQIVNLNSKKRGKFEDLGKKVYSLLGEGKLSADVQETLKVEIDAIAEVDKEIEKNNSDIENLNEDLKKVGATDKDIQEAKAPEEPKPEEPKQ